MTSSLHELTVVATANNLASTPASFRWLVDTAMPNVEITSPSAGSFVNTTSVTFAVDDDLELTSLECAVDAGNYAPCT